MTDTLRQEIYSHFDKNGIAGSHLSSVSISFDITKKRIEPYTSQRIFQPKLSQFGLDSDEASQVIIDYVFHTTNIKIASVSELLQMRKINDKPFILLLNEHESDKIKYCLAFGTIPGSVIFRGTDDLETLGNIEEIIGDLGFSDSNINDLGKLKRVEGNIWIGQWGVSSFTKLKSLQELEFVGGDISIKNSNIENLGNLKRVRGNLNLRQTLVKDLGMVEFIGGNLLLPKELKGNIDTSKTTILGKIKYYNDRSLDSIL